MGEKILVADDDRDIVKAIKILLEREGYAPGKPGAAYHY